MKRRCSEAEGGWESANPSASVVGSLTPCTSRLPEVKALAARCELATRLNAAGLTTGADQTPSAAPKRPGMSIPAGTHTISATLWPAPIARNQVQTQLQEGRYEITVPVRADR